MARTSSGGGRMTQNAHDEWKKLAANEGAANGEPKSDASTIEEQCAGVVEQRFDEAVEFSALTRNPYNRRL